MYKFWDVQFLNISVTYQIPEIFTNINIDSLSKLRAEIKQKSIEIRYGLSQTYIIDIIEYVYCYLGM